MKEKLLRLLESFKDNGVSDLLLSIREKIVTTINSDYFSDQSKTYFAEMEKCPLLLMSYPSIETIPAHLKAVYLITTDNKLYYVTRSPNFATTRINASDDTLNALKKSLLIEGVTLNDDETCKILSSDLSVEQKKIIFNITGHLHTELEPFANFSHQPKKIIQIKELINALHYAQLTFADLENVNLRNGSSASKISDLYKIYSQTVANAYKASYLITHLDVDLTEAFSDEISVLTDLFSKIQAYADGHKEGVVEIAKLIKAYPIAFEAGKYTGIAIDQLQPNAGKVDYSFLTQFSAVLPGYIQQFTTYLREYTAKLTDFEPNLDKQKISELEDNAVKLLGAINSLQDGDALLTVKIINYINIINHIVTLSTSIIHETGHMTETSQDVIRDTLAKIKYEHLPQLFALADKIEDRALLAPGTVSKPLMEAIVPYYQELIHYVSKPVNFTEKGEELLTIEDFRFIQLRLKETRQRINHTHEELIKAEQTKIAFDNFFAILEKPEFQKLRLADLDADSKLALAKHFRFIQPWFEKNNLALNNEIITSFTRVNSRYDKLVDLYNWVWAPSADSVLNLLSFKKQLSDYVESGLATHRMHIQLNENLIKGVYQRADISMRPLDPALIDLKCNDAKILNLTPEAMKPLDIIDNEHGSIITNASVLTADQTLTLYTSYEEKHREVIRAQDAYNQFMLLIKEKSPTPLFLLSNSDKETLRNLYLIFQPFFVNAFIIDNGIKLLDKAIITNLQPGSDISKLKFPVTEQHFITMKKVFEASLNTSIMFSKTQRNNYYNAALEKYNAEVQQKELKPNLDAGNRANFIIRHTRYSEAVAGFRLSLFEFTKYLNQSMTDKLKPAQVGLPFPEMEDQNLSLSQEKQIVTLKRIFNGLFHLEEICHELENLDNTSTQVVYVYHLALAYKNINSLKGLIKNLINDPQLSLVAKDLMTKVRIIKETLSEGSKPYLPDANLVSDVPEPIQYQAIWYSLHAFMLIPEHIQALNSKTPLTTEQLASIQSKTKQTVVNIERIIKSADSYFKLLLEAPTMYALFKELRQKLALFTSTSHDAALSHLKELNSDLFTRMLLEADRWESKLHLKPGLISGQMKSILDEFYKGLNEPLGLLSKTHIAYVTNMDAFDKRTAVNNKRTVDARIKQLSVKADLDTLNEFIHLAGRYTHLLKPPAEANIPEHIRNQLVRVYKRAYPIIMEAQSVVGQANPDDTTHPDVDKLLHGIEDPTITKHNHIHSLAVSTACYLNGLLAGFRLEHNTAVEQDVYLKDLRADQIRLNKKFILDYTNNTFEKRVGIITGCQTDLLHLNLEYNEKLKVYLADFKSTMVAECLTSQDINASIKKLLQKKTIEFQRQYLPHYTQLDNSLSVIAEFRVYFKHTQTAISNNETTLFEDQKTIGAKTGRIDALETVARNSKIPVEERIGQLRHTVNSASFEMTIMDHRKLDVFSFAWLQRLFLKILEVFKLYTPKHVKCYNNLKDSLSTNPELPQHRRHHGFFAEAERHYDLPRQAGLTPGDDLPLPDVTATI